MQRDIRRGFNIRRHPTLKDHSTDIDEIQIALSRYRLDKLTNTLEEWAVKCLLDFYKRHGFTGIVELDEVPFYFSEEEQIEFCNSLTVLQTEEVPFCFPPDGQSEFCNSLAHLQPDEVPFYLPVQESSEFYNSLAALQPYTIPWDSVQQDIVPFN